MEIRFWGVRGSIASPGGDTAEVGGNTSCVEVLFEGQRVIFDAGTGIRRLGDRMMAEGARDATLLLSHLHWDHIQGLPFFVPAYVPGARLTIAGGVIGGPSLGEALATQMRAPNFPVRFDELGAAIGLRETRPGDAFSIGEARVRVARLNHPGGALAYRLELGGASVVYATDNEHYACVDPALRAFAEGATVLIYDAQYTPEEYAGVSGRPRVGWGHSTYVAAAELAKAAGAQELVLFHHDPTRSDEAVADIERRTRALFPFTVAAREGLRLHLSAAGEVEPAPETARAA